jgi:hypothetical protein
VLELDFGHLQRELAEVLTSSWRGHRGLRSCGYPFARAFSRRRTASPARMSWCGVAGGPDRPGNVRMRTSPADAWFDGE